MSSDSAYGPPSSADSGSFRGRGGGRSDSFRARGRGGDFHQQQRSDRGRDDSQHVSPPLPPPDNESNSSRTSPPPRRDTGSRPQYSRYGTLITDGGAPNNSSNGHNYQYSRGGGRGGRDGGIPRNDAPFPTALGPPRPMMFVPPPMAMVPMMVHPGAGGRGGGLHVQPPRGPPLVVSGGGFRNPPPMQTVHHQQPQHQHRPQVYAQQQMQVQHMQPSLPMAPPSVPLPAGWSEHYTPQGLQYFFNAATGVSTYARPTMAAAAPASVPAVDSNATIQANGGATTGKWIEYKDDTTGQLYYFHSGTRETVWEQPEAFRMQQAREEVERMQTIAQEQAAAEAQVEAKKKQEAEQRSKMYEHLSREERVALFKEFLEQKEISPSLKWQDAQRFIAKEGLEKDPRWRFALSSAGEKKQSFAEYCTQAINKQNIEKRRQVKKNREDFLDVLAHFESLFVPGSSFAKGEPGSNKRPSAIELEDVVENPHFYAVRQDPRWLVIEDQKEKRSLFNGFMQDIVRKHEQQVAKQKDATKKRFIELLRKKADASEIALRSKRRLDSTLKQQLWDLLQELADKENALKNVEKYDVYDWSEELLNVFRDEEHEQRKRERELCREREAQQLKELDEKLRAMITTGELTASSQWGQVHELLSAGEAVNPADNAEEKPESEQPAVVAAAAAMEDQQLSERAQRRVFETIVKELRLALQPTVDVVSAFLSKASSGTSSSGSGFEVQEACTFEAYADALADGIKVSVDEKKPEDGEEEDETMEDASTVAVVADSEKADDSEAGAATAVALSPEAQKEQRRTELETLVKSGTDSDSPVSTSSIEFPAYVREVYDLLVALAKEKKAAASAPSAAAAGNPQSSDRAARSTSRSRKRRRDDGRSPSSHHHHNGRSSISRSRSRPRPHKTRSRSPGRSRSRSKPKPLDRSVVWNTGATSSADSSSKSKFMFDPLNSDDAELALPPQKPKPAPLTAEEESARAEEIIRQARLKLQAKQEAGDDGEELEEGEEPEEGEEEEE